MSCFHPLTAWKSRDPDDIGKTGKVKLVFKRELGYPNTEVQIACGQCIGCRLDKARAWAIRCVHESSLYRSNIFVTLTYDNDHLPLYNSLSKRDLQLFFKRLRKHFPDVKIRYFACGEYGEQFQRPHYHAIIFNLDFADKILFTRSGDNKLYTSATLAAIWGLGHCLTGDSISKRLS